VGAVGIEALLKEDLIKLLEGIWRDVLEGNFFIAVADITY
jgi:hypothetical protein